MDEDIKKILEKNQETTEEILKIAKKLKTHMHFQQLFSIIKILIIAIPIAIGIIYLPPLLSDLLDSYQELLGIGQGVKEINPGSIDLNSLPPDLLNFLKK
ncbi:hypothetical protein DRH27_02220 [Candidatus Falkowbacteria bacterium]|nr:MAG: hypothetical protein DRH27_02220 [Candidatus Falkowbacteria bacterium]